MNLPIQNPVLREVLKALRHPVQKILLRGVYRRIEQLEYRAFNRRYYAVEQVAEYLIGAQIPGDYCEFGVWQGTTFSHAYKLMAPYFPEMRFVALDSYEGLPKPNGIDAKEGYSSHFYERQFSCSREEFLRNLRRNGVDLSRVKVVKGWFNETLTREVAASHGVDRIAVAWIDCDLYESTVPVLEYLTGRISEGSVILFDDWRCFRNLPDFGQQRAVREWLHRNPRISMKELLSFGWNGIAFTVEEC
jgi:O-methyltransferase